MVVAQGLEEGLDFLVGLVLKERKVGAEAVTQGVLSNGDFAGRGAGSGRFLRVAAIGFDLGLSGHGGCSYSEKLVIAGVFEMLGRSVERKGNKDLKGCD